MVEALTRRPHWFLFIYSIRCHGHKLCHHLPWKIATAAGGHLGERLVATAVHTACSTRPMRLIGRNAVSYYGRESLSEDDSAARGLLANGQSRAELPYQKLD